VLVTGANGFIGAALCRHLAREGRAVIGLVRRPEADLPGGIARRILPQIGPETDWTEALAGVDCVVHLAARVHILRDTARDPLYAFRQVNTYGTQRLAEACRAQGVRRFVFMSSVKALGDGAPGGRAYRDDDARRPTDAYGQSKAEAEEALAGIAAGGLEVVVLRPPLVYGPWVRGNFRALLRLCDGPWPLPLGSLDNRRSLLALDNLVDAVVASIDHKAAAGRHYLLRDGQDLATGELVGRLRAALGRPPRLVPAPHRLLELMRRVDGLAGAVERLTGTLTVDDSGIRRDLGWTPPIGVDAALARVAAAWRASAPRPVL